MVVTFNDYETVERYLAVCRQFLYLTFIMPTLFPKFVRKKDLYFFIPRIQYFKHFSSFADALRPLPEEYREIGYKIEWFWKLCILRHRKMKFEYWSAVIFWNVFPSEKSTHPKRLRPSSFPYLVWSAQSAGLTLQLTNCTHQCLTHCRCVPANQRRA